MGEGPEFKAAECFRMGHDEPLRGNSNGSFGFERLRSRSGREGAIDPKQSLVAGSGHEEKCSIPDVGQLDCRVSMDAAARELLPRFISSSIENRLEQQEPSSGSSRNAGSEWGGTGGNRTTNGSSWHAKGGRPDAQR